MTTEEKKAALENMLKSQGFPGNYYIGILNRKFRLYKGSSMIFLTDALTYSELNNFIRGYAMGLEDKFQTNLDKTYEHD
jgi:hypothetical protein